MTDVRLTATNPEDSTVVPVSCNAKGELLLEEPIQGPQGDKGDKGDKGDPGDPGADGDPFSGNFAGDVYLTGNTYFKNHNAEGKPVTTSIYGAGRVTFSGPATFGSATTETTVRADGTFNCISASWPQYMMGREGSETLVNTSWTTFINPDGDYTVKNVDDNQDVLRLRYQTPSQFLSELIVESRGKRWLLAESGGLCHLIDQSARFDAKGDMSTVPLELPELRNIPSELTMVEQQLQKVMERLKMAPEAGWEVWDGED